MKIQEIQPVILASQSPRRRDILQQHGVSIVLRPTHTDEHLPDGISPEDAVCLLSREKAEACYREICPEEFREGLIIAADTIVYKDEILGKPKDEADAFRMLSSYRHTVHQVMTGVTLIDVQSGAVHSFCETTHIRCKDYSDEDIWTYIRECRPFDKAGAYGIQEDFSKYIDRCDGDYENVVGLPFSRLERETDEFTEKIR